MNLIITCPRHHEEDTCDELVEIFKDLGDEEPIISISNLPGILTLQTKLDPIDVIKSLRILIGDEPWSIRYSLRFIPIQEEAKTTIEDINKGALNLIKKIQPEESYRITIEKRNSDLSTQSIISKIAEQLPFRVSLENPDWVILIEIIGEKAGISVIKEDSILSVQKTKRSLAD